METWNIRLLTPRNFGVNPMWRPTGSSYNLAGVEQVVSAGLMVWKIEYQDVYINNWTRVDEWERIQLATEGRVNPILVPIIVTRSAPWPIEANTGRVLYPRITRIKDLDGTPYEYPIIPPESEIIAEANSTCALGGTSVAIQVTQGQAPRARMYFSHNQHLYKLRSVGSTVGDTTLNCQFIPPAREPIINGETMVFDQPVIQARLEKDDSMELVLENLRRSQKSVTFIEDVGPMIVESG